MSNLRPTTPLRRHRAMGAELIALKDPLYLTNLVSIAVFENLIFEKFEFFFQILKQTCRHTTRRLTVKESAAHAGPSAL
jgi:hypothetical protein